MLWIILGISVSYLVGGIPTAYIFGRILKGVDIRKFGSGNVGATNAWRLLGKKIGITVLLLDLLKGLIPVVFLGDFLLGRTGFNAEVLRVSLGLSCIFGHIWTVFLGLKGGKGIATTFGVFMGLAMRLESLRLIFALLLLSWLAVFWVARIVSLASVACAVSLPVYMLLFKQSNFLFFSSFLLSALVIYRHKSNLQRIFSGKEPRLSFKKSSSRQA